MSDGSDGSFDYGVYEPPPSALFSPQAQLRQLNTEKILSEEQNKYVSYATATFIGAQRSNSVTRMLEDVKIHKRSRILLSSCGRSLGIVWPRPPAEAIVVA